MKTLRFGLAAALLLSGVTAARADNMHAVVKSWDAAKKRLELVTNEILIVDPSKVEVPAGMTAGSEIHIDFTSSEDGFTGIQSIRLMPRS